MLKLKTVETHPVIAAVQHEKIASGWADDHLNLKLTIALNVCSTECIQLI